YRNRSWFLLSVTVGAEPADGEPGAQLLPSVVQILVEGAARGLEALGEDVDRDLVDRDRHQHLAPPGAQRFDLLADRAEELGVLGAALGRRGAGEQLPPLFLERDLASLPGPAPQLHGRLEQSELVSPGGEPAFAAEVLELVQDREQGVIGALLRE